MKHVQLLYLLLLSASLGAQTNYYVGNNGTDSPTSGLTSNDAFASFEYALDFLEAGDTLNVRGGLYTNENYQNGDYWKKEKTLTIIDVQGTASAWITIRPEPGENVRLKGDGLYIAHIRNCAYLNFEGFKIRGETPNIPLSLAQQYQFAYRLEEGGDILYRFPPNTPAEDIEGVDDLPLLPNAIRPSYFDTKGLVIQNSHHVRVRNNHIRMMPGTGMRANGCSYVWVTDNEIENCSRRSYSGTHGLVFEKTKKHNASTGTKMWIQRNHVHHNYNQLFSWNPNKKFVTPVIDEGKGISMQRNDAGYGFTKGRIRIENNLCHDNGFSGIHSNYGRAIDIINNTCVDNDRTLHGSNHGISLQRTTDAKILNNVVVSAYGNALAMSSSSDATIRRNHVQGAISATVTTVAINTTTGDPLFVGTGDHPYQLSAGSPARNVATGQAPDQDFLNNDRGNDPDLGCYEYVASGKPALSLNPAPQTLRTELVAYPNPTSATTRITGLTPTNEPLQLLDAYGRALEQFSVTSDEMTIDLSAYSSGMYLLRRGRTLTRIVKQ